MYTKVIVVNTVINSQVTAMRLLSNRTPKNGSSDLVFHAILHFPKQRQELPTAICHFLEPTYVMVGETPVGLKRRCVLSTGLQFSFKVF